MLISNILLPTAFADPSRRAAPYVRELVRAWGCVVHVVHVVEDPRPITITGAAPMLHSTEVALPIPDQAELIAAAKKDVEHFASTEFAECKQVRTGVVCGDIATRLTEYARVNKINLIVMGTHSSGIWHRIFSGSVGERVLEAANCPVLLVPIRDHEKQETL